MNTEAVVRSQGPLYFLCAIDVPWLADGLRDRPDRRQEMHELFALSLTR